ncbi:cell division protein ZapD [Rosenbergiella sp. S61]|uniref:Cell division protein ZapD n=1 Tax=Rosenbergiella gaditana TaxID=2726987 RepID=A0ABS5SWK1_9GAMM|nr:cell division protein ZapD [Rosenbergiella gaditana]MBT0724302.1 cell division protein ZapD [Rosenbergiella gaditana]
MTQSPITFEYPLNEKMRSWLRVEHLLQQLAASNNGSSPEACLLFLRTLTELLDIFERSELRADLLKELEKQQGKLHQWLTVPDIDVQAVNQLISELSTHSHKVNVAPKFGTTFKEDRFIGQLRQRLSIPGGYCNFDTPTLHLWLHLPLEKRQAQLNQWYSGLEALHLSLQAILHLIRQSGRFNEVQAHQGFYQHSAEDKDLIRITLNSDDEIYPQVSGHKARFSIRFFPLENDDRVPEILLFQLACC